MVRAALISNGPSADQFDPSEDFDVVVCARSAVNIVPRCDYWCVADWRGYALSRGDFDGNPVVVSRRDADVKMERHGPEFLERWRVERKMYVDGAIHPTVPANWEKRWYCWSGSLALGLMTWIQPDELCVYGMDLVGENDCIGASDHKNRSEIRWRDERHICDLLFEQLTVQGVSWFRTIQGGHVVIGGPR